jgi:hypothetical protein
MEQRQKEHERFFAFSGDRLTLTAPPMRIGGVEQDLVAIWQHLAFNKKVRIRTLKNRRMRHPIQKPDPPAGC